MYIYVSYHIQSHLKYVWDISVSLSFAQFFPVLHTVTISLLFIICRAFHHLTLSFFSFLFFNCVCSVFICMHFSLYESEDQTTFCVEEHCPAMSLGLMMSVRYHKWEMNKRTGVTVVAPRLAAVPKTGGR